MRPEAIFGPVSVLALWTGLIVFLVGCRRILAVRAGRVRVGAFRLGESPEVPEDVAVFNRNLMNLLEMPMLFYVACLAFYVTHRVVPDVVILAWIYAGLRMLHSIIHTTINNVIARLLVFAFSNFVLLVLWIRFAALVL